MSDLPTVAHVISTPSGFGGAERILSSLVDGGKSRGWHQVIFNPFDANPTSSALAQSFRGRAEYQARSTSQLWQLPAARKWLRGNLADLKPQIIHAHLPHALALVASLPRSPSSKRFLSHQHGDYLAWRGRRGRAFIDKLAIRRFDRIVACSDYVNRYLLTDPKLAREKVTTILNGWEGCPVDEPQKSLRPTVICVANFRPEKGHDFLIASFLRVTKELPDAQLLLVGSGPLESVLRKVVSASDLDGSVHFLGAVENIWPLLSQADVFTLASRFEPLGIVVVEAMAAGLPVVATTAGGIPELVNEGVTGFLVTRDDEASLANRLVALLRSDELRESMGRASKLAAEPLRTSTMLSRYFDLYEKELPT